MREKSTSKFLILLVLVAALLGALAVAGCGGGGSSSSSEATTTEGAEEEAGGGESAALSEGKSIFTSTCGSCHTLKEAGTSGKVGPNLDELEPDLATVEHQVQNGGGGMPAFGKEGTLSPEEIVAVAMYVSTEAGTG